MTYSGFTLLESAAVKLSAAAAAALLLQSCATPASATRESGPSMRAIDDSARGHGENRFFYSGKWEFVRGRHDGRSDGTSSRSRHVGDFAVLSFEGPSVRLYGVKGPNGGDATISIDGANLGSVSFYAPKKQTHALIFQTAVLSPTAHVLALMVAGTVDKPHNLYVNIDDAQIEGR